MSILKKIKYSFRYFLLDVFGIKGRIDQLRENANLSAASFEKLQENYFLEHCMRQIREYQLTQNIPLPHDSVKNYVSSHFPVITKNDLLQQRELYYPNAGKKSTFQIVGKTSGTTGSPLDIFRSYNSIAWENAFVKRHWLDICESVQPVKRATLRGDQIEIDAATGVYWMFNPLDRQLLLSSKHLNEATFSQFSKIIQQYQPEILQAYPSMAFQMATYAAEQNIQVSVDYVFTASEMLYDYQRELIEKHLGRVVDFYGMAERVAMATECKFRNLHVNTDYSFVEILDDDNNPTSEEGYIVGTTFHNEVMPLIRYKLSDRTKWKPGTCQCGSHYPMIEPISGKFEDILYDTDHRPVSPSLITFAFKGVNNIKKSQVAQIADDKWVVRVVPATNYVEQDGNKVIQNLRELVSDKVNAEIVLVEDIAKTSAGKYRWVLNETTSRRKSLRMNRNKSQKINLMIGTDPVGQGGIAAVEQTMLEQPLAKDWQIQFVSSHKSATKIGLLLIFVRAFYRIFALRLTGVPGFAHIHLASRGSFSRKALLAKWASFLGFRILLHLHGAQFDQFYERECSPAKQQKVAKLFYLADMVVVLGDKWLHWVSQTFPAVKQLKIVYNPGPSVTLPRQLSSTPTLLFLGRLGERKGVHDLIAALPEVIQRVPDLKIILGGDGDLDRFRRQAESAGILSHIEFAGWIGSERKFQLLASSTAFVLPSYNEGFPVGIIEAMACGIPIVATTVGGIPDAITDGQEGLLVPAGDISALSQALIRVLTNQTLAHQLSSQAKHKYAQNFSCEAIMPLWDQLYMEISNG